MINSQYTFDYSSFDKEVAPFPNEEVKPLLNNASLTPFPPLYLPFSPTPSSPTPSLSFSPYSLSSSSPPSSNPSSPPHDGYCSSPSSDQSLDLLAPSVAPLISQVKKGSIQSILNSGSELQAMETAEREQGHQSYYKTSHYSKKDVRYSPYNKHLPHLRETDEYRSDHYKRAQYPEYHNVHPSAEKPSCDVRHVKGLRHFSRLVYERVSRKKVTTYNDVADELLYEMQSAAQSDMRLTSKALDYKNIRRRVYDSLNVFMALDIISKNKKEIKWLGLPSYQQEQRHKGISDIEQQILQEEYRQKSLQQSLRKSEQELYANYDHLHQLKQLISRNRQIETPPYEQVHFPFFLVASNGAIDVIHAGEHQAQLSMPQHCYVFKDFGILSELSASIPNSRIVSSA